jgi:hypothetical protein
MLRIFLEIRLPADAMTGNLFVDEGLAGFVPANQTPGTHSTDSGGGHREEYFRNSSAVRSFQSSKFMGSMLTVAQYFR